MSKKFSMWLDANTFNDNQLKFLNKFFTILHYGAWDFVSQNKYESELLDFNETIFVNNETGDIEYIFAHYSLSKHNFSIIITKEEFEKFGDFDNLQNYVENNLSKFYEKLKENPKEFDEFISSRSDQRERSGNF